MRNTAMLSTTLVIVWALASSPAASQVPAAASSSGAPVISDHVAASWHIEQIASGPVRLVFLLLYRGQPELPFDSHNVFLIDRVDGVGGPPRIVDRLRIDPELKLAHLPVTDIIAATPRLQAFVWQE